MKRLTVTGGVRWERIEGYLPDQQGPASRFFPDGLVFQGVSINGVTQDFTVRKTFDAVHENPLWHNWGPRVAASLRHHRQRQDDRQGLVWQVPRSNQHRHAAQSQREHQSDLRLERPERRLPLPAGQLQLERGPVRRRGVRQPAGDREPRRRDLRQDVASPVPQRAIGRRRPRAVPGDPGERLVPAGRERRTSRGRSIPISTCGIRFSVRLR